MSTSIDDLLVASDDEDEHEAHLRTLFDRLRPYCIILNPLKCQFVVPSLDYLVHTVDEHGIRLLPEKVDSITSFSASTSLRKLREFGLVNFYRRLIPRCSDLMQPHTDMLRMQRRKISPSLWMANHLQHSAL